MVERATRLRIAARGSQLALWQAENVRERLLTADRDIVVTIEVIRTTGDRITDVPLSRIGDRGLFTKEVDEAILDGRADVAVHSLKDVPTTIPDGLHLAAVSQREDPRDVLIGPPGSDVTLVGLPAGARVGTSSLRRRAQLRRLRPDVNVIDLRGNLNTRLDKLDRGSYDAIVLAAAGVIRLGWQDRITEFLSPESWLPAVGQGALAIVTRSEDLAAIHATGAILHEPTHACVSAERAFLRSLEGGCQVPIGALATLDDADLRIDGFVSDLEGTTLLRDTVTGPPDTAVALGESLARRLVAAGAEEVLEGVRAATSNPAVQAP